MAKALQSNKNTAKLSIKLPPLRLYCFATQSAPLVISLISISLLVFIACMHSKFLQLIKSSAYNIEQYALARAIPNGFSMTEAQESILILIALVALLSSQISLIIQWPVLIKKAQEQAHQYFLQSNRAKNGKAKLALWHKGMALLMPSMQIKAAVKFPKPGTEQPCQPVVKPTHTAKSIEESFESLQAKKIQNLVQQDNPIQANSTQVTKEEIPPPTEPPQEKFDHIIHSRKQRAEVHQLHNSKKKIAKFQPKTVERLSQQKLQEQPIQEPSNGNGNGKVKHRSPDTLPWPLGNANRYQINSFIACGGMGNIYGGEDTVLNKEIAIKQLFEHLTQDREQLQRFKQEALSLAKLKHPNIMPIYDLIAQDDQFWIVMEWIKGPCLADLIETQQLSIKQNLSIAYAIADAMDSVHKTGTIHRDIKPLNVLITASGTPKLTDFGTAKLNNNALNQTQEGMILGSPAYMSPEQAAGQTLDARTDIYSLGVTLFYMLTSTLPFQGDTVQVLSKHITQAPPEPSHLNAAIGGDINKLILKMMAKSPNDRVQSMEEVKTLLKVLMKEY